MTELIDDPPPSSKDKNSELEQQALFGDHQRGEGLKKHIYNLVCCGMYLGLIFISCMVGVWAWHITAPHCWRWLSEVEVHMLERLVFGSGLVLTFATRYFKKHGVV